MHNKKLIKKCLTGDQIGGIVSGVGNQINAITSFIGDKRKEELDAQVNRKKANIKKFKQSGYNLHGNLSQISQWNRGYQNATNIKNFGEAINNMAQNAASTISKSKNQKDFNTSVKQAEEQATSPEAQKAHQNKAMEIPTSGSILSKPANFDIDDSLGGDGMDYAAISRELSTSQKTQKLNVAPMETLQMQQPEIAQINPQLQTVATNEQMQKSAQESIQKNGSPVDLMKLRQMISLSKNGNKLIPKAQQGMDFSAITKAFNNNGGGFKGFSAAMNATGLDMGTFGSNLSNSIQSPQEQGKYGNVAEIANNSYDIAQNVISKFNPGIGAIMGANKVVNKLISNIGGGTDGMTKADAILGSSWLAPLGWINGFGGSKSHTLNDLSDQTNILYGDQSLTGFGGTTDAIQGTMQYSNKKYGLVSTGSRKKANRAIDKLNTQQSQIQDIAATASDMFDIQGSMAATNGRATQTDLNGGYQQNAVHVGKQGFKFEDPNDICVFKFKGEVEHPTDINFFKNGGQMNVIPEGALHARLHHMENGDKITKKGIPVVDNSGEQQAEIECNEIIFNKDVTEKLEKLWKDGSDEAAIEAGKLLAEEIINNTDDRTGLIKTIE